MWALRALLLTRVTSQCRIIGAINLPEIMKDIAECGNWLSLLAAVSQHLTLISRMQ